MTHPYSWIKIASFAALLCLAARTAFAQASGVVTPIPDLDRLTGSTAVAFILLSAFAIGRVTTAALFLFQFVKPPAPDAPVDEDKEKLVYYGVASVLALLVLLNVNLRVLATLKIPVAPLADHLFTFIVLVGGAGTIADLLKVPAGPAKEKPQPIEITGTLVLDENVKQKLMGQKS